MVQYSFIIPERSSTSTNTDVRSQGRIPLWHYSDMCNLCFRRVSAMIITSRTTGVRSHELLSSSHLRGTIEHIYVTPHRVSLRVFVSCRKDGKSLFVHSKIYTKENKEQSFLLPLFSYVANYVASLSRVCLPLETDTRKGVVFPPERRISTSFLQVLSTLDGRTKDRQNTVGLTIRGTRSKSSATQSIA